MSGVSKVEVLESAEELRELMKKQKTPLTYAKVQALYLLKINAVDSIRHLAVLAARDETIVHRWLRSYREGGIEELLAEKKSTGRPKKIKVEDVAKLQQELRDPQGFSSYKELNFWLNFIKGVSVSYSTLYRCVRYELQAKLKVPRPKAARQDKGAIKKFWLELPKRLSDMKSSIENCFKKVPGIHYWVGDETRLGLQTLGGKKLTLKGVKPEGLHQWKFEYIYLYGLVEPRTGNSFFYEYSHVDSGCFENFLEQFSLAYPEEIHIIQLDNARSHTAKNLSLPENVYLIFQPPYCPEVNAIERVWEYIHTFLEWLIFESLDQLREKLRSILEDLNQDIIASLTGWNQILMSLSLAGL